VKTCSSGVSGLEDLTLILGTNNGTNKERKNMKK